MRIITTPSRGPRKGLNGGQERPPHPRTMGPPPDRPPSYAANFDLSDMNTPGGFELADDDFPVPDVVAPIPMKCPPVVAGIRKSILKKGRAGQAKVMASAIATGTATATTDTSTTAVTATATTAVTATATTTATATATATTDTAIPTTTVTVTLCPKPSIRVFSQEKKTLFDHIDDLNCL